MRRGKEGERITSYQCTIVSVRYLAADGLVSFECWKIFRGGLRPLGAF